MDLKIGNPNGGNVIFDTLHLVFLFFSKNIKN
jgi:hypothetical protein